MMRAIAATADARRLPYSSAWSRAVVMRVAVAAWVGACLALGTWVRLQSIEANYTISDLRLERAQLIEDSRGLQLELASLGALDRIEAIASGKLGMTFPTQDQMVRLP
ncbi:MAG: cell division protein FtsL [Pseudomonadota bacterium]